MQDGPATADRTELVDDAGRPVRARSVRRSARLVGKDIRGPLLLIDTDATAFIPAGWRMELRRDGIAIATHKQSRGDDIDDLTEEDEAILDRVWDQVAKEQRGAK